MPELLAGPPRPPAPDWSTALVAVHWPAVTVVACDLPEHGWHRAEVHRVPGRYAIPVPDRASVAVTYLDRDRATQHVPLPHDRARRAARLADDATTDDPREELR